MVARFPLLGFLLLPFFNAAQVVDTAAVREEVDSMVQLNREFVKQLNFEEALQVIEIAERKAVAVFGENNALYAQCLFNHGRTYVFMIKYEKAEPLYLKSLALRENVLGKEHEDYAWSLNNLGSLYFRKGEYNKAEPFYLEAIAIREKILGKEHPYYAASLSNLAVLYDTKGEYSKAELLHLEALTIFKKKLGKKHSFYASGLDNLAILYRNNGEYNKAEVFFQEVKVIREQVFGKENPIYATSLSNLGILYLNKGEYNKAEPVLLEAIAIQEKKLKKEHPDYAISLNNLGVLYHNKGEYSKAEPFFLEAKAIREKVLGKEHPGYAKILSNLALLYSNEGEYSKAEPFFMESILITKHILQKSATYLPSQELEKHIGLYQNQNDAFYTFTQLTLLADFNGGSYNQALFYKGFCLETASLLEQAMRNAPDSIRNIHALWKGDNRRLAAELSKPIAERKQVAHLDSMATVLEKALLRAAPAFAEARRQVEWQEVRDALQPGEAAIEFIHYSYAYKKTTDTTMYSVLLIMPGDKAPHFIPLCEARQLDTIVSKPKSLPANDLQNLYGSPRADGLPSLHQLLWDPIEKLLL